MGRCFCSMMFPGCQVCCCTDDDEHCTDTVPESGFALGLATSEEIIPPHQAKAEIQEQQPSIPPYHQVAAGSADSGWSANRSLDGTWVDWNDGKPFYHYIHGESLRWANNTFTTLQRGLSNGNSLTMHYRGRHVSAALDASGEKLEWDDGDSWHRAGIDGLWAETSGQVNQIEGYYIRTKGVGHDSEPTTLTILDDRSFSIVLENQNHKAFLDVSGQQLLWEDGDIWHRIPFPVE